MTVAAADGVFDCITLHEGHGCLIEEVCDHLFTGGPVQADLNRSGPCPERHLDGIEGREVRVAEQLISLEHLVLPAGRQIRLHEDFTELRAPEKGPVAELRSTHRARE